MYDKKKQNKPQSKKKSINFADSLQNSEEAASMAAPEYAKTLSNSTGEEEKKPYDTGGSITFYVNGFLPERDYLGNEQRSTNADQDSEKNGEVMHQDESGIKSGEDYWGAMDEKLEERFTGKEPNADSTFYFDGSAGPLSSAKDRMEYGENAAKMIVRQVQAGEFQLDENGLLPDTINVVGHSMGAAYAAGLTKGLLDYNKEQGKTVFDVRATYYFAPHQPLDIEHPSEIRGVQYSHKNDAVTSDGDSAESLWGLLPKGTGSSLAPISGIHEFMVHDVPGLDNSLLGDRGGHNITDHDYTLSKYKPGRDGYISENGESEYDSGTYNRPTVSTEGYEKRPVHLPQLIDKLEGLPGDMRQKIDELKQWLNGNVSNANSVFKEKVSQGREWLDDKREDGKEWVDEKINQGDEWLDDKIDKGNEKVDEGIDSATDWLKDKSGGLLNCELGSLSDWVRGKKNRGVNKVKKAEDQGVDYAKAQVNKADAWLSDKTGDLHTYVTDKSTELENYVNAQVNKISAWAHTQVNKGEKAAKKVAKSLEHKLRVLIKKIMARIEKIKKRVNRIIMIIKEAEAWD